jgi:hypothetical protein
LSRIDDSGAFSPLQAEALMQLFGDEGFELLRLFVINGFGLQVFLITLLMGGQTIEASVSLSPQHNVVVT